MGRTPKPLRILVHPAIQFWPELATLQAQGHSIETQVASTSPPECPDGTSGSIEGYDLVLGPNCWRMAPVLREYLDDAVKAARKLRYPKEKE